MEARAKLPRDLTLWGRQGGSLARHRIQTHAAIGTALRGFYFTFAIRAFGRWARIRLMCRAPYIWFGYGNMNGR